jgi:hypothetical protein
MWGAKESLGSCNSSSSWTINLHLSSSSRIGAVYLKLVDAVLMPDGKVYIRF